MSPGAIAVIISARPVAGSGAVVPTDGDAELIGTENAAVLMNELSQGLMTGFYLFPLSDQGGAILMTETSSQLQAAFAG